MRHFATACLSLLMVAPAWAQTRPRTFPTRDVTVTYQDANNHQLTVEFGVSADRMRVSGIGAEGDYAIIEPHGNEMTIVTPARHIAVRLPESPKLRDLINQRALSGFRHAGSASVAGMSCDVWDVHSANGDGEICVTSDGVMLRARRLGATGSDPGILQAIKVDYRPLPASDFTVPAGYPTMTLPQMMGGAMPPATMPPGVKPKP
ncbi:MAG: hypothetical protein KGK10_11065 [Rhodospirillales bacterium]|nr:hypothetical protein [Rhodospirillales bacterium]